MYVEIGAILGIFLLSYLLIIGHEKVALYVLLVLSVLLHKELFSFYQWDLLPVRAFMFALMAASLTRLLVSILKKRKRFFSELAIPKDPVMTLLVLLWLIRGISIVNSWNIKASLLQFGFFTTIVFMFFWVSKLFSEKKLQPLVVTKFYIGLTFLLTLFGYFQAGLYLKTGKIIGALWNIPGNIPRIGASFWDVNHYGALLAMLLPVAAVSVLTTKSLRAKAYYLIVTLSLTVALFLTNSRTAWMTEGFAVLVFALIFLIKRFGSRGITIVIMALLLVAVPGLIEYSNKASPFRAKIKQYLHYRMDSFDSHMLLLTGAMQIYEKYPVIGGGYGSFFEHFSKTKIAPTFFGRDPAALNTRVPPHTIWGELLSETGFLGFSVYLLMVLLILGVLIYAAFSAKDRETFYVSAAMGSALLGLMIAGMFYSYNSEFFWLLIVFYLLYGISTQKQAFSYTTVISYFMGSKKFLAFIVGLLAFCLIGLNLGTNHLIPWDEAIYAKVAKNMVLTGDYLNLQWLPGKAWFEKPPLYMWLMAGLMQILGFSSWASRLPSAILGLALVVLVFNFGALLKNKTAGFIAALSLLTTTQFLYYARAGMFDVSTTFFTTLALYFYYLSATKKKSTFWFLSGLAVGFAVMIKGVVGGLPLLPIALLELLRLVRAEKPKLGHYGLFAVGLMLVGAPWHIYMYLKNGFPFVQNYIGYHVLDRAMTAIEDKGKPFLWYVEVMKVSMRIWFVLPLAAFPYTLYKVLKKDSKHTFLFVWTLLFFLFFSFAKSKLVWYIIPIYPAVALINGIFAAEFIELFLHRIKVKSAYLLRLLMVFVITMFALFYLSLNKGLVYTSDFTGSQARLLQEKDSHFGKEARVYTDRIELPLALFYTDGPFEIIDFLATKRDRVPEVAPDKPLILLTKNGRYVEDVSRHEGQKPYVVKVDGDYTLWYFDPLQAN